jgi:hypothetical protein
VEVFAGQPGGVSYVVANSALGGWDAENWEVTSSPTSGVTPGAFGASRLAVGHETDQRLVLFVSDDDPDSPAVTVWYMAQAKAGRSGPGN